MEKEILSLVESIRTLGGGVGILVGMYMAWKAFEKVMEWKLGPQKRVRTETIELGNILSVIEDHRRDDMASHSSIAEALHSVTKQLERCEESQRQTVRVLERLTDKVMNLGD